MSISAKIIADSKNQFGQRITSFVLVFPRIVLAEFNTHRAVSRNSASSRAIPFKTMLKLVMSNPFVPIKWMKDHSGMQGTQYFSGFKVFLFTQIWLTARNFAVLFAWTLSKMGLTKQIVNRLLEPFMWHTVIATATEWQNYFALRAADGAEIHIQELAYLMLQEYNLSTPRQLKAGEWHIPFGDSIDEERIVSGGLVVLNHEHEIGDMFERKIQIATARCARVSYMNFEGKDDYHVDVKLFNKLEESGHMSPFEHCARAMNENEFTVRKYLNGWCGNFQGFIQLRKEMDEENKSDTRVIKK